MKLIRTAGPLIGLESPHTGCWRAARSSGAGGGVAAPAPWSRRERTPAARVPEQPQHVVTEAPAHQGVQGGVEGAAGVRQRAGDVLQQQAAERAGHLARQHRRVRQLERHEDQNQRHHELQGAPPAPPRPPPQRVPFPQHAGYRRVARHHDGEGHAEDGDDGAAGEGFEPFAFHRAAVRLAVVPRGLGVERLGEAEERSDEPHGGGGRFPDRQDAPAQPERGVRPGHRRVAVHADAGQQQEAAVRVDGVAGARGAVEGAGGGGASAQGDGGLQRQREEQQEVGQRQVEQEDLGHGAQPQAAGDGEGGDHQAVPRHAEQEDQAEDGELEGLDGELLLAGLAVVRLPATAEVCGVAGVPRVDGEVGAVVVRVADVVPDAEIHHWNKSTSNVSMTRK